MAFAIIGGRTRFWQWDRGQKLAIYDDTCGQVHFCNGTTECALVRTIYTLEDGTRVVDVPDIILQTAKPFTAYLYRVDADSQETMRSYRFEVAARSKPADYGYVEPEGEGGNAGGLSADEKTLFLSLFKNAIYTTDMTTALAQLEAYWSSNGGSGDSGGNGGNEGGGDTGGGSGDSGGDEGGGDDTGVVETLPSWIAEMQVIEFTPEADTNTAQTFAISMENEPNMVFVNSDFETPTESRDLAALTFLKTPYNTIARWQYHGVAGMGVDSGRKVFVGATTKSVTDCSISASEIVLTTAAVGTEAAYWRAGHTYKIYCVKTVFDTTDMAHTPSFAKEVYPIVFSPEADTNEAQTFAYEMENEPNALLIISDLTEIIAYRDFVGAFVSTRYSDVDTWRGYQIANNNGKIDSSEFGGTSYGVLACGNGSMTFQTGVQGGTPSKWKAGYNYLILFMYL